MAKWLITCILIVVLLAGMPPWVAVTGGGLIGLGLSLIIFVGAMCGVYDVLRDWD